MRVLLFHGYLLRGTGSNVYNAELAQALARLGHEVHLLCQDRQADQLPWVDAVGDWRTGSLRVRSTTGRQGAAAEGGSVTVYQPEIEGLLPVYVHDHYDGFVVKTYPELADEELERYIALNVGAVREVAQLVGGVDAALANHLVMGPVILARAGLRFAAKIHGSDLSYTVRPHPERFVPFAREGMEAASAALVGSLFTAEDLWRTVALPGLKDKTRLGPPGLDPAEFAPLDRLAADGSLRQLAARLRADARRDGPEDPLSAFGRNVEEAAAALDWYADAPAERVVFVGKLLVNKGVDLLLAAWPLVVAEHPRARLLLAGFGAFARSLEALWSALGDGDVERALAIAVAAEEAGQSRRLRLLESFLSSAPSGYTEMAKAARDSVMVSGRLEHSEVAIVVPAASALVMPSTFPEAFGMVAAEAAACGVLPVSAGHSGMAEVSARLAEAVEPEIARLLSFKLAADPVGSIAERLNTWLGLAPAVREQATDQLRRRSVELWSWFGVAGSMLAASAGELTQIPAPKGEPKPEFDAPGEA